jgi:hypothetical protein
MTLDVPHTALNRASARKRALMPLLSTLKGVVDPMANRRKPAAAPSVEEEDIDNIYQQKIKEFMKELYDYIKSLDPSDPNTLKTAVSSLVKDKRVPQAVLAQALGQSRIQIGRFARGKHFPRTAIYRKLLVEEALQFMGERGGFLSPRVQTPPTRPTKDNRKARAPAPTRQ